MKYLATIFVLYLTLITVAPTACQLIGGVPQLQLCSSEQSFSACDQQTETSDVPTEQSEDNNCCVPCCTIPSCNCVFVTEVPLQVSNFEFDNLRKLRPRDETLVSNYLPDCWQPPEMV